MTNTLILESTEQQEMIRQSAKDFAETYIRPYLMDWDEKQIFPKEVFHKMGEFGFMGVLVPEIYGGSELGGIIKDGAKMVNAMANSVVPKFTFIVGNSYGAGNYAMCGKAYDPRLIYALPTAQMAVMSGASAAKTLLQIQEATMKAKGVEINPEQEKELLYKITTKYNSQLSPYYAASNLWVDGVIGPLDIRKVISMGIEAANHAPIEKRYNVGVIQT